MIMDLHASGNTNTSGKVDVLVEPMDGWVVGRSVQYDFVWIEPDQDHLQEAASAALRFYHRTPRFRWCVGRAKWVNRRDEELLMTLEPAEHGFDVVSLDQRVLFREIYCRGRQCLLHQVLDLAERCRLDREYERIALFL